MLVNPCPGSSTNGRAIASVASDVVVVKSLRITSHASIFTAELVALNSVGRNPTITSQKICHLLWFYWEPIGSRIWEIDWYQNEWPWPLFRGRIKVTSTIALHLTLNISETVRDWFRRITNRKWHMGYRMVTWPITSRDLERSVVTPIGLERNISKTIWAKE